jgi:hypothetical protein
MIPVEAPCDLARRVSFWAHAFMYARRRYDADRHIPDSWRDFHERVLLNDQISVGYFSILGSLLTWVVHMIKAACPLDDHTS